MSDIISKIRSATLGAKKTFKREKVEITDGVFVEIRQPTTKERGDFRNAAMAIGADNKSKAKVSFDSVEFSIQSVIGLTVEPGTDNPVFTEADREQMLSAPAGGWFDKLAEVASTLCNVNEEDAKKA